MKDLESSQREFNTVKETRRSKFLALFDEVGKKLQEIYADLTMTNNGTSGKASLTLLDRDKPFMDSKQEE